MEMHIQCKFILIFILTLTASLSYANVGPFYNNYSPQQAPYLIISHQYSERRQSPLPYYFENPIQQTNIWHIYKYLRVYSYKSKIAILNTMKLIYLKENIDIIDILIDYLLKETKTSHKKYSSLIGGYEIEKKIVKDKFLYQQRESRFDIITNFLINTPFNNFIKLIALRNSTLDYLINLYSLRVMRDHFPQLALKLADDKADYRALKIELLLNIIDNKYSDEGLPELVKNSSSKNFIQNSVNFISVQDRKSKSDEENTRISLHSSPNTSNLSHIRKKANSIKKFPKYNFKIENLLLHYSPLIESVEKIIKKVIKEQLLKLLREEEKAYQHFEIRRSSILIILFVLMVFSIVIGISAAFWISLKP